MDLNDARILTPEDVILIENEEMEDIDTLHIVHSNSRTVDALLDEFLKPGEISRSALMSCYVNYYYGQVCNGGICQFVSNCWADTTLIDLVRQGLLELNAPLHHALFAEITSLVSPLKPDEMGLYLSVDDDLDITMEVVRKLEELDERFFTINQEEDLEELNALWLWSQDNIFILSLSEWKAEIARRASAVPDRASREQAQCEPTGE